MNISLSRRSGFTLVEIMVVVATIGMLAGIAMPNLVHARKASFTEACINNLRQIDGAKQQWAMEYGKLNADLPSAGDIQPYLGRGNPGSLARVYCPVLPTAGYSGYTINVVGTAPVCNQADSTEHPAVLH